MGVSVSHPLRRSPKVKYIQTDGEWCAFDETEQFLSQSTQEDNNAKGETLQASKGSSKRNQFKGVRGNSRCPFDSLNTIDSRKSVPFAVLPENNTEASTSTSDSKMGFNSIQSDGETFLADKTGKVSFFDEADGDLEDGCSAQKFAGKLKEKNRSSPAEYVHQKVIAPLQGKLARKDRVSSSTRSGEDVHLPDDNHGDSTHAERADGRENERESELGKTRMVRADSETKMARPSNRCKLGSRYSTSEKFS